MKLKQWLYGAAALSMLAACSDKDVTPDNGDVDNGDAGTISGYLAVEIKLPQEAVTRADDDVTDEANDQFRDGLADEYKVNNAMIVVFKGGTDEKTAVFQKAVDLTKPFFTNVPSTDQITSSYIAAIPVDKLKQDGSEHYYGLVILNRDNTNTTVPEGKDGFTANVKVAGLSMNKGTTTFNDILGRIADNINFMANGFFMINAPLSNKPVSQADAATISYLTDLGTQTYESIDEAKSKIQSCVYVERAVAKVTGKIATDAYQFSCVDKDGQTMDGVTVTANVKYALTNTNRKSYVIRNVETANLGDHFSWDLASTQSGNGGRRMIGSVKMPGLNTPFHDDTSTGPSVEWYRTYWCADPNYSKNAFTTVGEGEDATTTTEMDVVDDPTKFVAITIPLYCRENTFDVAHQNNGNSTMVVFQVDYTITKGGYDVSDLYVKDGDYSKVYLSDKDAAWEEISRIYNDRNIQLALEAALKASDVTPTETEMVKNAEQYLEVDMSEDEDNELIINSIYIPEGNGINAAGIKAFNDYMGSSEDEGSKLYNLLSDVNNLNTITVFDGGVSYYSIPVMHFGQYYCPWDKAKITGTTTKEVYNNNKDFGTDDNHAKDYLGRYGMVRNNWYELSISQILTLGSPTIPEIDLTLSNDNNEDKRYIGVEIHVLSWAKRSQDVKF